MCPCRCMQRREHLTAGDLSRRASLRHEHTSFRIDAADSDDTKMGGEIIAVAPRRARTKLNYLHCKRSELKKFLHAKRGKAQQCTEAVETSKLNLISQLKAQDAQAVYQFAKLPSEIRMLIYEHLLTFEPDAGHCYPQILRTSKWVHKEARHIMRKENEVEIHIVSTAWPGAYLVPTPPGVWSLSPPYGAPPSITPVVVTVPVNTRPGPPPAMYVYGQTYEEWTLTVWISIGGRLLRRVDVTDMHVLRMYAMWPTWVCKAEKLAVKIDRREGLKGYAYFGEPPHMWVEHLLLSLGAAANACKRLHFPVPGTGKHYVDKIDASLAANTVFRAVERIAGSPSEEPVKRAKDCLRSEVATRMFEIIEDAYRILITYRLVSCYGICGPLQPPEAGAHHALRSSWRMNLKLQPDRAFGPYNLTPSEVEQARCTYNALVDLLWEPDWYSPEFCPEVERLLRELSDFVECVLLIKSLRRLDLRYWSNAAPT